MYNYIVQNGNFIPENYIYGNLFLITLEYMYQECIYMYFVYLYVFVLSTVHTTKPMLS